MIKSKIRIEPRVVQHLGQDLITSAEVAVTELLKNSIDAKAAHINIHLYDTIQDALTGKKYLAPLPDKISDHIPDGLFSKPVCIIEDDGKGMTPQLLNSAFLSIGTSDKAGKIDSLGEKGIGRLSTQRLGSAVVVETKSEGVLSFLFLNWEDIVAGHCDVVIHDIPAQAGPPYTRLWILNTNLDDYVTVDHQTALFDTYCEATRELKTALCFLISPFYPDRSKNNIAISMLYQDKEVNIKFDSCILECAESKHYFTLTNLCDKVLDYGLTIQPWYVERVHQSLLTPIAFDSLKQPHEYYRDFVVRYSERIRAALHHELTEDELIEIIAEGLIRQSRRKKSSILKNTEYERASRFVKSLKPICPIESEIYGFKQKTSTINDVVLGSIRELHDIWYDSEDVKNFLSENNGIKLYRGSYRIGFLGNKENDWVKLQQFRTKGQQFYRFDLGNTVGYVSLHDPGQEVVREISSRLDLIETEATTAFKLVISVIFNQLFYDLNRTANALIKNLLQEEGLLVDKLEDDVKKSSSQLKEMQRRTKEMQQAVAKVDALLQTGILSETGDEISFPLANYNGVKNEISRVSCYFLDSSSAQSEALKTIESAQERLDLVNVS